MAEQRVTQIAVETVGTGITNARTTQVAVETVGSDITSGRATQSTLNVISSEVPGVAMSQSLIQAVSYDPVSNIRVSQVFISAIYDVNGIALTYPNGIINMPAGV